MTDFIFIGGTVSLTEWGALEIHDYDGDMVLISDGDIESFKHAILSVFLELNRQRAAQEADNASETEEKLMSQPIDELAHLRALVDELEVDNICMRALLEFVTEYGEGSIGAARVYLGADSSTPGAEKEGDNEG